jgi:hypothetical protein
LQRARSIVVIDCPHPAQQQEQAAERLQVSEREVEVEFGKPLNQLVFEEKEREGYEAEEKINGEVVNPADSPVTGAHAAGIRNGAYAGANQAEIKQDAEKGLGRG